MGSRISPRYASQVEDVFDGVLINGRHLCYALGKSYNVFETQVTRLGFEISKAERVFYTQRGNQFVRECIMLTKAEALLYIHKYSRNYGHKVGKALLEGKGLNDINIYKVLE